jgi:hypothetical protein
MQSAASSATTVLVNKIRKTAMVVKRIAWGKARRTGGRVYLRGPYILIHQALIAVFRMLCACAAPVCPTTAFDALPIRV